MSSRDDAAGTPLHQVLIRQPEGPPLLPSDVLDEQGDPLLVSCAYCHSAREPDPTVTGADSLNDFHLSMTFEHGSLACAACHEPPDYETLRLANGSPLPFQDVMALCAQCHGPQWRDYQSGAHGGMTGHWDLTRGGRTRNNCIDCHDPHAPAFPVMQPAPPPRDRFLSLRPHTEHLRGEH